MKQFSDFTITILRQVLKAHALATSGKKADLVKQLDQLVATGTTSEEELLKELESHVGESSSHAKRTRSPEDSVNEPLKRTKPETMPTEDIATSSSSSKSAPTPLTNKAHEQLNSDDDMKAQPQTRSKRNDVEKALQIPQKRESPPSSNKMQDTEYYFRYIRQSFLRHRGETLIFHECTAEEVGWQESELSYNRRQAGTTKAVHFIADNKNRRWVVKQSRNIESSFREYEINVVLREHQFLCVATAELWCKGKISSEEAAPDVSFLVLPFVKNSHTCKFYADHLSEFPLPALFDRLVGLVLFMRFLHAVSPQNLHDGVTLFLGDVHLGQILLTESGYFFLIDFGVCQLVQHSITSPRNIKITAGSHGSAATLTDPVTIIPLLAPLFPDCAPVATILTSKIGAWMKVLHVRDELQSLAQSLGRDVPQEPSIQQKVSLSTANEQSVVHVPQPAGLTSFVDQ